MLARIDLQGVFEESPLAIITTLVEWNPIVSWVTSIQRFVLQLATEYIQAQGVKSVVMLELLKLPATKLVAHPSSFQSMYLYLIWLLLQEDLASLNRQAGTFIASARTAGTLISIFQPKHRMTELLLWAPLIAWSYARSDALNWTCPGPDELVAGITSAAEAGRGGGRSDDVSYWSDGLFAYFKQLQVQRGGGPGETSIHRRLVHEWWLAVDNMIHSVAREFAYEGCSICLGLKSIAYLTELRASTAVYPSVMIAWGNVRVFSHQVDFVDRKLQKQVRWHCYDERIIGAK